MNETIHGGNVYRFAKENNISISQVMDFSANINPLGMSPKGTRAIIENIEACVHYPDPSYETLIALLSKQYNMPTETILPGNGAAELLFAICHLPGLKNVWVPNPGFSEYGEVSQSLSLNVYSYNQQHTDLEGETFFAPDYDYLTSIQKDNSILFLGHPNNPDGTLLEEDQLRHLLESWQGIHSYIVIDESFIDFLGPEYSFKQLIQTYPNLIVLHSLTKFLSIPGLRLGLLYSNEDLIKKLKQYIPTWSVNQLAVEYALASLVDTDYLNDTRLTIQSEKVRFQNELESTGLFTVYKPSANFILLHWKSTTISVNDFHRWMENKYIMMRNCQSYPALDKNWIRLAIKKPSLNNYFIQSCKEFSHEYNLLCSSR